MTATDHHGLQGRCLSSRIGALLSNFDKQVGSHHATVQPVNFTSSLDATEHPDIRAVDLGDDFRDQKLWQTKDVGQFRVNFLDFHTQLPRLLAPQSTSACGAQASELMWVGPSKITGSIFVANQEWGFVAA